MITIKEIAERLEVSPTTVSNVINGHTNKVSPETEQRVREALEETNYTPRMGLRVLSKGYSQIIGVVIYPHREHENTPFADPFYSQVVGVLEEEMHRYEYFMMAYSTNKMNDIYKMAAGWNVDGVIALCLSGEGYRVLSDLIKKPVVGIDVRTEKPVAYSVGIDDDGAAYSMAALLLEYGYRRIKVCLHDDSHMDHVRSEGVRRAIHDFGDKDVDFENVKISVYQKERLEQLRDLCAARTPDTVLFFLCDGAAVEALHFLKNQGIEVPKEMGVVGFDDINMAAISIPPLTTIHQNVKKKALLALDMLIQLIRGEEVKEGNIVLPTHPVIRESIRRLK